MSSHNCDISTSNFGGLLLCVSIAPDMETFHLLSRGGAKFDKKRFSKDVQLFHGSASASGSKSSSSSGPSIALDALKTGELPPELDFFKYAAGGIAGAASKKGKEKARVEEDDVVEEDEDLSTTGKKKRKRNEAETTCASH